MALSRSGSGFVRACQVLIEGTRRLGRTVSGTAVAGLLLTLASVSLPSGAAQAQSGYTCYADPRGAYNCSGYRTLQDNGGSGATWTITAINGGNPGTSISVNGGQGTFNVNLGSCRVGATLPCNTGAATYTAASGQYGSSSAAVTFSVHSQTQGVLFVGDTPGCVPNCAGGATSQDGSVVLGLNNFELVTPLISRIGSLDCHTGSCTNAQGYAVPAGLSCGYAVVDTTTVNCGTLTLTQGYGPFALGAHPLAVEDSSDFSVDPGGCANAVELQAGQSCTTGQVTFHPSSSNSQANAGQQVNANLTISSLNGGSQSIPVNGLPIPAGPSLSPNGTIQCAKVEPGQSAVCVASFTVYSGAPTTTLQIWLDDNVNFTLDHGGCTSTLGQQGSCTTGTLTYHPDSRNGGNTYIHVSNGHGEASAQLLGRPAVGTLSVSPARIECGAAGVGTSVDCGQGLTYTAVGDPVVLSASPVMDTPSIYVNGGSQGQAAADRTHANEFSADPGTCTAGRTLQDGESCTTGNVFFNPYARYVGYTGPACVGCTLAEIAYYGFSTNGNGTLSTIVEGTPVDGTLVINPSPVTCPNTLPGKTVTCNDGSPVTITAQGGAFAFGRNPIQVGTTSATYAASSGNCTGTLAAGQTCTTGAIYFNPSAFGDYSTPATATAPAGTALLPVSAAAVPGLPSISGGIDCGLVGLGATHTCTGTLTFSSSGGDLQLNHVTLTGDTADFTFDPGGCTDGLVLADGDSCTTGVATFTARALGSKTALVTFDHSNSAAYPSLISISATGIAGTLSVRPTYVNCDPLAVGTTGPCSPRGSPGAAGQTFTLSASDGPVNLTGISTNNAVFALDAGSCAPPLTLQNGDSCTTGPITYTPGTAGGLNGQFTFTTDNDSTRATVQGFGVLGTPSVSPTLLSCDPLGVGSSGPCSPVGSAGASGQTVTFSVSGGPLTLTGIYSSNPGSFSFDPGTCTAGRTFQDGESCTTGPLTWTASSAGGVSTTLRFNNNTFDANIPTVFVQGTGVLGTPVASLSAINCGTVDVGTSQDCGQTVTVTAVGGPVTLTAVTVNSSPDFSVDPGTCTAGSTLAAGATCTTGAIRFTPTHEFGASATLSFQHTNYASSAATVALSGTGVVVYGTPTITSPISCPDTPVGASATCTTAITITASNGPVTFTSSNPQINDTTDFTLDAGTCTAGSTIASGSSCTSTVTFHPAAYGVLNAQARYFITSDSGGTSLSSSVSGNGTVGSLQSQSTVSCPDTAVGGSAACTGTITLTAVGGDATVSNAPSINDTGSYDLNASACASGTVIPVGTSCAVTVTFHPQSEGAHVAYATFYAVGQSAPLQVQITGNGVLGTLVASPSPLACGAVQPGTTAACAAGITFTAVGGRVTLSQNPALGDTTTFPMTAGTCTAPLTLQAGDSCTTGAVSFSPPAVGQYSTGIRVYYNSTFVDVAITGAGVNGGSGAPGVPTLSSALVDCGTAAVGTSGSCTPATVTLTAVGGPLTLGAFNAGTTQDFPWTGGTCASGATLASGDSCTLGTVGFTPSSVGSLNSYPSLATNNGTASLTVTGTGAYGHLVAVGTTTLTCGSVPVGSSGTCSPTVTLRAVGGPVTLAAPNLGNAPGVFTFDPGTCTQGTVLQVGDTCTTGAETFAPSGAYSTCDYPSIQGVNGSPVTITACGTGIFGGLTASGTLTCPTTALGATASCTGSVTITAVNGPVTLASTPLAGSDSTDFAVGNGTCTGGLYLASGASCTVGAVSFTPTTAGTLTDTVTVNTASGTGTTFTATGSGNATLTVSPTSLTCPANQGIGTTGSCGPVTLTANGGPVTLGATPLASSDGQFVPGAGGCPAGTLLAAGASCTTGNLAFTPTSAGPKSTTVTVSSSAATVSYTASGSGGYGALAVTSNTLTCAPADVGATVTCTGSVTLTASNGPVTLATTPFTNSDATDFTVGLGTCTAGLTIASGSSCTTGTSTFHPTMAGALTDTVTVNPSNGSGTAFTVTGSGNATLTVASTSLACGSTGIGLTGSCGTVTVTAHGGTVTLGATPFSSSDGQFVQALGTCTANAVIAAGSSCTTGNLSFTPTSAGAQATTVTVSSSVAPVSYTASGSGAYGSLTASGTVTCPATNAGSTSTCTGTKTLTATGGAVILAATPFTNSDGIDFTVGPGTCTAGSTIASGASCTVGTVSFNPATAGAQTDTVTVNVASGTGTTFTLTGTGNATLTVAPASLACGPSGVGTTATCGTVTLTANGGSVTLGTTPFASSDGQFVQGAGGCTASTVLAAGSSCTTSNLSFTPTSAGAKNTTVTVSSSVANVTYTATGTGVYGSLTAANTVTCPATNAGSSSACTGSVTLTASGGSVVLAATPFTNSNATDFTVGLGTCTAGSTIAAGSSCIVGTITFNPVTSGAKTDTVTVNTASGSGTSFSVNGTANAYLTVAPASLTCSASQGVGITGTCGTVTLAAVGGPVTLGATPFSSSDAQFSQGPGSCSSNAVIVPGTPCTSGQLAFTPTSSGAKSTTITVSSSAPNVTYTATGTGVAGNTNATGTFACGSIGINNGSGSCGVVTITAGGGPVVFGASSTSSNNAMFTIGSDGCANKSLASGQTCAVIYRFAATAGGVQTGTITVSPTSGTGTSFNLTGTGTYGTANFNPATLACAATAGASGTCTATVTVTGGQVKFPATPISFTGTNASLFIFAGTGTCAAVGAQTGYINPGTCTIDIKFSPATLGIFSATGKTNLTAGYGTNGTTVAITGTATAAVSVQGYNWTVGAYGACSGGSGAWSYGSWTPASGCGAVTQTRTASCNVVPTSGTQTQAVTCTTTSGTVVANSYCQALAPPTPGTQACTPDASICGASTTSQSATLTDTCSYSWTVGAWSAPSSTCSSTATQTRTVTCTRSDGTTVANSFCTGSMPATSQTVSVTTGCTYQWTAGTWGACTGGSSAWTYSSWTPTSGCGTVTQTRTGTCAGVTNTGSQTRTVNCTYNGGVVPAFKCSGTAPSTVGTCTPTPASNASCGTQAALSQSVTLTNTCTAAPGCVPDPAHGVYCIAIP